MSNNNLIPIEARWTLVRHMEEGRTMKAAAALVGVSQGVVQYWLETDEDFQVAYRRAQLALSHNAASDSVDLLLNTKATDTEDPKRAMAHVSIAREQSRALQWYASRLNPEQYGEKVEHRGTIHQAVVLLPPLDPLPAIARAVPESESAPKQLGAVDADVVDSERETVQPAQHLEHLRQSDEQAVREPRRW